jgi:hypothetical protein
MIMKTKESDYKTKTATGTCRFLIQKVVRPNKCKKLIKHPVHRATYTILNGNEASNHNLTNIYTQKSDIYFRLMMLRRADCLPTPVNLQR